MTSRSQSWRDLSLNAHLFVGAVISVGGGVLVYGAMHPEHRNLPQFFCYLLIAVLASRLKSETTSSAKALSVDFIFILLGILELSFPETLALGCFAILLQLSHRERTGALQISFRVCASAMAIAAAYGCFSEWLARWSFVNISVSLLAAAAAYFVVNTGANAGLRALTQNTGFAKSWGEYSWALPFHLMGAAIALFISWCNREYQWQTSLLLLPVIYMIYRSYRLYWGKRESEKRHMHEMENLHLRTIEALALAIEAKDHTTHDHLQRVRIYAVEVAKNLKVAAEELEALNAAALLHDIGKLAVPEHIISKPGRLTPEEFEKMKIHPLVGAEILERVRFPYPVVPIVRAHHEKWDGSGYPAGLKGEEIPIGARILSAVDFLDALASDRQYRRALPLDEVIKRLSEESGKSFDPQVVGVLKRRYRELERIVAAQSVNEDGSKLSTEVKVARGSAPAAGFEKPASPKSSSAQSAHFLSSIAAARQEAQTLFELSQDLGASLSIDETLSMFSVKLRRLVPYDTVVIYVKKLDELVPQYVSGDNFRLFTSLKIPMGQGLSGWVAQNRKPIVNGNPLVEPGYVDDGSRITTLRSCLAVPLEGLDGVVGVLALYNAEKDAFTSDHLRMLLATSSKMALAIENALKYEQAESSATTDYLTGLPNARSLFLELDRELARCKRDHGALTIMVCDMDGFKKINDRFGHLEGNRVLRIFSKSLRDTSREYDYVARMGGDEFVVVAPGLPSDAVSKKAEQLRELARLAGREVSAEDMLSLSIGQAVYPGDGENAEQLLAAADRRMYLEKQHQPERGNRRVYPRLKCRLTIEMRTLGDEVQELAHLVDISTGGCYIETRSVLPAGTILRLSLTLEDSSLTLEGRVLRLDAGTGVAVEFHNLSREQRDGMHRVLEFVHKASDSYDNYYLKKLAKL